MKKQQRYICKILFDFLRVIELFWTHALYTWKSSNEFGWYTCQLWVVLFLVYSVHQCANVFMSLQKQKQTRNVSETYMPPLVLNSKLLLICTRHGRNQRNQVWYWSSEGVKRYWVDNTVGWEEWFDLDLGACDLKINRDHLLIGCIPCTKFGNDQVKGSKDIDLVVWPWPLNMWPESQ